MHDACDTGRTRANSTPSRRTLLGAAAALPVAALPAAAVAGAGDDAELLALRRALIRHEAAVRAISAERLPPGISDASCDQEARLDGARDDFHDAVDRIIDTPARTAAGRWAKADALRMALEMDVCDRPGHTIANIDEDGALHECLAWSLARDVLEEGTS